MSKRLLVEQKHTKAGIEFVKEGLEEFGIEKKQTIKTMLLVEEVLVKLREHAKDPDENICIILNNKKTSVTGCHESIVLPVAFFMEL